jgi:phosphoglycolate phosphatase
MQKNLNKNFNLFLFDLDGTLLDTAREFHIALNEILDKENKPPQSFESVREKVSDGAGALVSLGFNIDEQNKNFEEKRNILLKAYEKVYLNSESFDGVEEVISYFEKKQINWGIVTNKPRVFSEEIYKSLGWDKKAKILVCPDDVKNLRKPNPASLNFALKALNHDANETVYVGDNWRDLEAAINAKITPIFAQYGYVKTGNYPLNTKGFNIKNIKEILSFI